MSDGGIATAGQDDLGFRPAGPIPAATGSSPDDDLGFRLAQPVRAARPSSSGDDFGFRSAPTPAPQAQPAQKAQPQRPEGPTISAAPPPSFFERARSTVANSAVGHALEETMPNVADFLKVRPTETIENPYEAVHAHEMIAPGAAFPKPGVAKGVAEFAGGLATPENVELMAATGGLGALRGVLGEAGAAAVGRLVSAGFSAQMVEQAVQQYPEIRDALKRGDYDSAKQLMTEAGLSLVMAHRAFEHAATEPGQTPAERFGATLDRAQAAPAEPVVAGETVPDYLGKVRQRIADQVAETEQQNRVAREERPNTAPPPILERPAPRTPMEELHAGAEEVRQEAARRQAIADRAARDEAERQQERDYQASKDGLQITDRRAVRPEDVEPYQRPRTFIGSERIPPSVVPRGEQLSRLLETQPPARPSADDVELGFRPRDTSRMLPPASAEDQARIAQEQQRYDDSLTRARAYGQPQPRAAAEAAKPQDITADSRRMANLAIGRFGNPVEQQYARDVWSSMIGQGRVPVPPSGMTRVRADDIRNGLAEISRGDVAGRVPDPRTAYAPDVLDEARAMMEHTHDFLSQQERPGRYFADMGDETSLTGRGAKLPVTAVTSLRGQFPWFANLKESPGDLAKALGRGEGRGYDRLITAAADHITRSRAETQQMARGVEPNLEDLAEQVRAVDPELADFLANASRGNISTWTETHQQRLATIEGRISDAKAALEFGRAIDDLAGEERAGNESASAAGEAQAPAARGEAGARAGKTAAPLGREVTPEQFASRSREEAGVLPGFGPALREQRRFAGIEQGRQLTEEMGRPPESIESAAGAMERESPLFRGTEASPQAEMFGQQTQALRTENLRLEAERNRPDASAEERRDAQGRIEQNRQMIEALERNKGEAGFATLDLVRDVLSGRLPKEAWQRFVAEPLIEKGLRIGDKYRAVREADPDVAGGLHLLDNAPAYFRAKASQAVQSIIGNLSRDQERLFTLVADADSRENLRTNHPAEFRQAANDPAIQEALRRYRPIEQQLTAARQRMGGATLDRDYLRRVYDEHVSGVGQAEAPGTSERATTAFDRVIQPQRLGNMSREATAEYHYQHGLHEFGPAFGTKFLATNLRGLEDQVARGFIAKATELKPGDPEPRSINYRGAKYYRPDVARDMREAGRKNVQEYGRYDPTAGVKYPQQGASKFLGPRDVVRALNDHSAGQGEGPGAVRRFLQEQVIGYGFGIPHVANILRRVTQSAPLGAANPEAWVRAWKVAFGKELRERGVRGVDDPTFDKLMQHGSITTGEMANLKRYWGGNLNPANWARSLAKVGHKLIFEPGSFGGLGGVDQRARIFIADLVKSQNPRLGDEQVAAAVNTQLGDYNRANWTDRQKTLSKFMLFPGWDTSSIRWVIQHPIRTTVPPALLIWTANQILNRYGQNRSEDASDIQNIHWGDRSIGVTLLRESMGRNLLRPAFNYAQSRIGGESSGRALGEAARGITEGAGGLVGMLRPDITAGIDLAMNRQSPFGGQELVSPNDYNLPGRILPNRALEKQAALVIRHAIPALDRMLDSDQGVDFRAFAGSNVGLPNYKSGAEQRLKRNAAEAMEVSQTVSRLAKSDRGAARRFIQDPDNAAYALFRNDLDSMSKTLRRLDDAKAAIGAAKSLSADEKRKRLAQIDRARQNLLRNADGLDRLLFERKQKN